MSGWKFTSSVDGVTLNSKKLSDESASNLIIRGSDITLDATNTVIDGNLIVNGTQTKIDTENLSVKDPLISLARENNSNILDIGFYGKYVTDTERYTGLIYDASDSTYKFFKNLTQEPGNNVNVGHPSFEIASLIANVEGTVSSISNFTTNDLDEGSSNKYFTEERSRNAISAGGDLQYDPQTGVIEFSDAVTSVNSKTADVVLDTDDILEGSSNVYFTEERARNAISAGGDLQYDPQTGVIEFSDAVTSVNSKTADVVLDTDDISEGSSNVYFTEERARNAIVVDGNLISYDSSSGKITVNLGETPLPIFSAYRETFSSSSSSTDQISFESNNISVDNVSGWGTETDLYTANQDGKFRISFSFLPTMFSPDISLIMEKNGVQTTRKVSSFVSNGNIRGTVSTETVEELTTGTSIGLALSVDRTSNPTQTVVLENVMLSVQMLPENYVYPTSSVGDSPVISVNGSSGAVVLNTSDIPEGSNAYFTQQRARESISAGTGIEYDSATGVISSIGGAVDSVNGKTAEVVLNTDDISEGSSNLYFTQQRARDTVSAGTGIEYDSNTGVISSSGLFELAMISDESIIYPDTWTALGNVTAQSLSGTIQTIAISPVTGHVYVGGAFSSISNVSITNLAKWDGQQWSSVGTPITSDGILALAVDSQDNLYVAARRNSSLPSFNGIETQFAKWDGTNWTSMGNFERKPQGVTKLFLGTWYWTIETIKIDENDNIYVGGDFTDVDNILVNGIAKWDGSNWTYLGDESSPGIGEVQLNTSVNERQYKVSSLGLDSNNILYISGIFTQIGSINANYIARWNGSNFSRLGSNLDGSVGPNENDGIDFSTSGGANTGPFLTVDSKNNVYVGGFFEFVGGNQDQGIPKLQVRSIAKWNGTEWSALANGFSAGEVTNLAVDSNDNVYVVGEFRIFGNSTFIYVAKWNGSQWNGIGSGFNRIVLTVAVDRNNNVYVGGRPTVASDNIIIDQIAVINVSPSVPQPIPIDTSKDVVVVQGELLATGGSVISSTFVDSAQPILIMNSGIDSNDNLYTVGQYSESGINIRNGDGSLSGITLPYSGFGTASYLAKYNSSGVVQWAIEYVVTSTGFVRIIDVAVDNDNIYIYGNLGGEVDIKNVDGTVYETLSNSTVTSFVIKLDSSGYVTSIFKLYRNPSTLAIGIKIRNGHIYLSGVYTSGDLNYTDSSGTTTLALTSPTTLPPNSGFAKISEYIIKLSIDGLFVWAFNIDKAHAGLGGNGQGSPLLHYDNLSIAIDTEDNIYISTVNEKLTYFIMIDSLGNQVKLPDDRDGEYPGITDIIESWNPYIIKLNPQGTVSWMNKISCPSMGSSLSVDSEDNLYTYINANTRQMIRVSNVFPNLYQNETFYILDTTNKYIRINTLPDKDYTIIIKFSSSGVYNWDILTEITIRLPIVSGGPGSVFPQFIPGFNRIFISSDDGIYVTSHSLKSVAIVDKDGGRYTFLDRIIPESGPYVYIVKYNKDGYVSWVSGIFAQRPQRTTSGFGDIYSHIRRASISEDKNGNVYATYQFTREADYMNGLPSAGPTVENVMVYNSDGTVFISNFTKRSSSFIVKYNNGPFYNNYVIDPVPNLSSNEAKMIKIINNSVHPAIVRIRSSGGEVVSEVVVEKIADLIAIGDIWKKI
jgi:hypothetical protein